MAHRASHASSPRVLAGVALAFAAGALFHSSTADACGSSGPDGISACSLAAYQEDERPRWRVGVSSVFTSTVIHFSDTLQAGETRFATVVELAYAPTSRLTLNAGLGVAIGGRLLAPDGANDFGRGLVASLGASYRFVDGATPLGHAFLVGSALLSYTGSSTELGNTGPSTSYNALDLRAGVAAGFTWLRTLSAYGLVRAFGGPVYWTYLGQSETGTDTHHYQVGGGLALLVAKRVDLFAEGVPLGEQAVAAGASIAF